MTYKHEVMDFRGGLFYCDVRLLLGADTVFDTTLKHKQRNETEKLF